MVLSIAIEDVVVVVVVAQSLPFMMLQERCELPVCMGVCCSLKLVKKNREELNKLSPKLKPSKKSSRQSKNKYKKSQ